MTGAASLTIYAAMAVAGFVPALMLVLSGRWGAAALAPGAFALVSIIARVENVSELPQSPIGTASLVAAVCGAAGWLSGALAVLLRR